MHTPLSTLTQQIANAKQLVVVGGTYRHYKSNDSRYVVQGFCIKEADETVCVLYSPLHSPAIVFSRPLTEWSEQIRPGVPRFNRVGLDK